MMQKQSWLSENHSLKNAQLKLVFLHWQSCKFLSWFSGTNWGKPANFYIVFGLCCDTNCLIRLKDFFVVGSSYKKGKGSSQLKRSDFFLWWRIDEASISKTGIISVAPPAHHHHNACLIISQTTEGGLIKHKPLKQRVSTKKNSSGM